MSSNLPEAVHGGIVPALSLIDPTTGVAMLEGIFGFVVVEVGPADQITLALGDQNIIIGHKGPFVGSARPHHLALSVPDIGKAMSEIIAKGGRLASSMTPDGPLEIPEFWASGVRYVFFEGPEGVLIELCMKLDPSEKSTWGHDHIGIECENIADVRASFLAAGCNVLAEHELIRSNGVTSVCFLGRNGSVVELFRPPDVNPTICNTSRSFWSGCVI